MVALVWLLTPADSRTTPLASVAWLAGSFRWSVVETSFDDIDQWARHALGRDQAALATGVICGLIIILCIASLPRFYGDAIGGRLPTTALLVFMVASYSGSVLWGWGGVVIGLGMGFLAAWLYDEYDRRTNMLDYMLAVSAGFIMALGQIVINVVAWFAWRPNRSRY